MLCALTAAAFWLILATYMELPVSTTHSIGARVAGRVCRVGWALQWYVQYWGVFADVVETRFLASHRFNLDLPHLLLSTSLSLAPPCG
jgi:phosphate/sulfate permease